jgi:hypothetical protein
MYAFCRLKEEQAFGIIGWCYPSCLYWQIILHDLILDIPPEKEYIEIEGKPAKWWFCSSQPALQVRTEGL